MENNFKCRCKKTVTEGGHKYFKKGHIYHSYQPEIYPDEKNRVCLIDHEKDEHFMDWEWYHEHFETVTDGE